MPYRRYYCFYLLWQFLPPVLSHQLNFCEGVFNAVDLEFHHIPESLEVFPLRFLFFDVRVLSTREREMFYLTTHSTHFIYGYMAGIRRKETFYLTILFTVISYGIRYMVKDHSDSEKENPLPPHRLLLLSINSKGSFICTIPRPSLHQSWSTGWNEK